MGKGEVAFFLSLHFDHLNIMTISVCRINVWQKVKDLACVKSYVDSKWEAIFDWAVYEGQYDFLLELIKCYRIPTERYIHHKGEMIACPVCFDMYSKKEYFQACQ